MCRPVAVNRYVCRLSFVPKPQLESQEACRPVLAQVGHCVDHCLRIESSGQHTGSVASRGEGGDAMRHIERCAGNVRHVGRHPQAVVDTLAASAACASRTAFRPMALHRSVCRFAFLPKPQLERQAACRALLAQVGQRVDQCLRIPHCFA